MKKLLLAAAVATVGMSAAQAAPTVYGKLNVSLDQVENNGFLKDADTTEVNSNASRLGVKGEEKLTEKLAAVYQAEWEVSTDTGTSVGDNKDSKGTDWKARNRFLGLKWAGIGTLKAGYYDSYFKTAAGNAQDIFNDHNHLDITNMMYGEDRLKNAIGFETDKKLLGGVQFNIMAQQGEDSTTDYASKGQEGKRDGFGDSISTSLTYDNKDLGLALGLAGNFGVEGKYAGAKIAGFSEKYYSDAVRVTGSYDFGKIGANGLALGALFQQAEPTDEVTGAEGLKEQSWLVAATYKVPNTAWALKAQYQSAETSADSLADDVTIDQYGLGVDYNLNKQTRFYGVVAQQKLDGVAIDQLTEDDKKTVFGIGMEYSF